MNRDTVKAAGAKIVLAVLLLALGASGCTDELLNVPVDEFEPTSSPGEELGPPGSDADMTPPTAVAGTDLLVADVDQDGSERIVLDGCASTAGGRPIVAYRWSEQGMGVEGVKENEGCALAADFAIGLHRLTLTVTDDAGRSDQDWLRVDIRSPQPIVGIRAPEDGSGFATGSGVTFRADASSWSGGTLQADRILWTSDLDGRLGTGFAVSRTDLSPGAHVISVAASDDQGFTASDTVTVFVGEPPVVTILAPAEGQTCPVFDEMHLEGTCLDRNGDRITGPGVHWEPDMWMGEERKYELSVDVVCSGPGPQTISLVCTDAEGIAARAEVTVEYVLSYRFNVAAVLEDFGCTGCHGSTRQDGGIRLDTHLSLTTGGNGNGPLIVPFDSTGGILIPKLLAAHHDPDWRTLTTPFYWGWVDPASWGSLERWWVHWFLGPWIANGAADN